MLFQQFCNVLQNESVYKNVDMNDFQRWLRPNFLTSTECLSESEIIQIVREEKTMKNHNLKMKMKIKKEMRMKIKTKKKMKLIMK